jgi:hypothetical protein
MPYTSYSGKVYRLGRINPSSGFVERIYYTGGLRQKPSGWKLIRQRIN